MMRGLPRILIPFHKEFNKSNNAGARMMVSFFSHTYMTLIAVNRVKTSIFGQIHIKYIICYNIRLMGVISYEKLPKALNH